MKALDLVLVSPQELQNTCKLYDESDKMTVSSWPGREISYTVFPTSVLSGTKALS